MAIYFANATLKEADTVILGIPYDRSSSFIPGSRFGPSQIRLGAENVETYSPYFSEDITSLKIHDAGDLILTFPTIKQSLQQIQKRVSKYIINKKRLVSLGGEHTVTIPIIREYLKSYPDLNLIQMDAHTDTRDEYLGEKFCHATVIKRISEFLSVDNIFQLGLRSLEKPLQNKNQFLFKVAEHIDAIKKQIGNKPCYLTLDIDVIDAGLMPAVQTPVPGGINYQELFASIINLSDLNFVGCDIVEYNPLASMSLSYASIVAEIVRELILMMNKKT
jgi:agmatinase